MSCETNLKIEMENKVKANETLKAIKEFLSQIDEKYDCVKKLSNELMVKKNILVAEESYAFYDEMLAVLPELFKVIAQNDSCGKFTSHVYYDGCCTEFYCDVNFEEHTLTYHSEYFPDTDAYYCPDGDCHEFMAHYEDLINNKTFTCPECGKVYTADELDGERPEITDETWYIE